MLVAALGLAAPVAQAQGADAAKPDEPSTLDIASSFPSTQPIVGPAQTQLVELINSMAGSSLKAKLHEPGKSSPLSNT